MTIAKIAGVLGLLLITYAIFIKKEIRQDCFFVAGGMFLLYYSYMLNDPVFMTLQVVFTGASLYEIYTLRKKK